MKIHSQNKYLNQLGWYFWERLTFEVKDESEIKLKWQKLTDGIMRPAI